VLDRPCRHLRTRSKAELVANALDVAFRGALGDKQAVGDLPIGHAAAVYTYRSRTDRFLFHRCECGSEWTEHRTDIDPLDPVSSDEVLEVHKRLAKFEGSIAELLESHSV
jgi:hypothetical protein